METTTKNGEGRVDNEKENGGKKDEAKSFGNDVTKVERVVPGSWPELLLGIAECTPSKGLNASLGLPADSVVHAFSPATVKQFGAIGGFVARYETVVKDPFMEELVELARLEEATAGRGGAAHVLASKTFEKALVRHVPQLGALVNFLFLHGKDSYKDSLAQVLDLKAARETTAAEMDKDKDDENAEKLTPEEANKLADLGRLFAKAVCESAGMNYADVEKEVEEGIRESLPEVGEKTDGKPAEDPPLERKGSALLREMSRDTEFSPAARKEYARLAEIIESRESVETFPRFRPFVEAAKKVQRIFPPERRNDPIARMEAQPVLVEMIRLIERESGDAAALIVALFGDGFDCAY